MTGTPAVGSEDNLHGAVKAALDRLLAPPTQWTTFPMGHGKLTPAEAAKLARLGAARGWPDLLIIFGGVYGIELKRRDGRLSKTRLVRTRSGALRQVIGQAEMFPLLELAGMRISVCRSVDEVLAAVTGWGIPTRLAA